MTDFYELSVRFLAEAIRNTAASHDDAMVITNHVGDTFLEILESLYQRVEQSKRYGVFEHLDPPTQQWIEYWITVMQKKFDEGSNWWLPDRRIDEMKSQAIQVAAQIEAMAAEH